MGIPVTNRVEVGTSESITRVGTRVRLRPCSVNNVAEVHHAIVASGERLRTWRTRGEVPHFDAVRRLVVDDVLLGACVETRDTGELVGLVQIVNPSPPDGTADLAVCSFGVQPSPGPILEGAVLLIDEAFARYPLRKIQLSLSTSALAQVSDLSGYLPKEGHLMNQLVLDGAAEDLHLYALWRSTFHSLVSSRQWIRSLSPDGFRSLPAEPGYDEYPRCQQVMLDELKAVLADYAGGSDAPWLRDSLCAVELLVRLDDIAGREVAAEALAGCADRHQVLELALALAR